VLSLDPENYQLMRTSWRRIAQINQRNKNYAEAEKIYKSLYHPNTPINSDHVEDVLSLGQVYVDEGKCDDAISLLTPYLQSMKNLQSVDKFFPKKKAAVVGTLAHACWASGRPEMGEKFSQQAILSCQEDRQDYSLLLARFYLNSGKIQNAIELQKATIQQILPSAGCAKFIEPHAGLAEMYFVNKQYELAQEQLLNTMDSWVRQGDHSSELVDDYSDFQVHLMRPMFNFYWEKEEYAQYEELLAKYLKLLPGKSFFKAGLLENLARAYCLQGKHIDEALASFDAAVQALPEESRLVKLAIQLEKAQWLFYFAKYNEAQALLLPIKDELNKYFPNSYTEAAQLKEIEANLAAKRGQYKEAIASMKFAIVLASKAKVAPANLSRMWCELGRLYLDTKDYKLAAAIFQKSISIELLLPVENLSLALYRSRYLISMSRMHQPLNSQELTNMESAAKAAVQHASERHVRVRENEQRLELLTDLNELKSYLEGQISKPAAKEPNSQGTLKEEHELIERLIELLS
jgi:predicted Zn-dependent protease